MEITYVNDKGFTCRRLAGLSLSLWVSAVREREGSVKTSQVRVHV